MARDFLNSSSQYLEVSAISSFPLTGYPVTLFGKGRIDTTLHTVGGTIISVVDASVTAFCNG
jgi:hypothetical protein